MAAKRSKKKSSKAPARKKARRRAAPRRSRASPAADASVEQIRRIIDAMVAGGAVEVEMEEAGSRLRIRLKEEPPAVAYAPAPSPGAEPPAGGRDAQSRESLAQAPAAPTGELFRSPMVGTFYRAPSPEAEPFTKIGDHVSADSVLCIIEAMKVMNEIKAEMEGEVVEILAQNGEPVDYGQPLFVIKV